jgi:hypothetical protein
MLRHVCRGVLPIVAAKKPAPKAPKFTKSTLPSKTCAVCGRPFEWRKKWEKVRRSAPSPCAEWPIEAAAGGGSRRWFFDPSPCPLTLVTLPPQQVWDEVKYCSDRCRKRRSGSSDSAGNE